MSNNNFHQKRPARDNLPSALNTDDSLEQTIDKPPISGGVLVEVKLDKQRSQNCWVIHLNGNPHEWHRLEREAKQRAEEIRRWFNNSNAAGVHAAGVVIWP